MFSMRLADLTTPALILDRTALAGNCAAMAARAAKLGVRLRPHMKTAKSAEAAKIATAWLSRHHLRSRHRARETRGGRPAAAARRHDDACDG
jgi:hypothetical protein